MPRNTSNNAFHVTIRSDGGHIAAYKFWRSAPNSDTYFWMRADGRGPAGGAVEGAQDDPVSLLAARVLTAAGNRLKAPAPTYSDSYDDEDE